MFLRVAFSAKTQIKSKMIDSCPARISHYRQTYSAYFLIYVEGIHIGHSTDIVEYCH